MDSREAEVTEFRLEASEMLHAVEASLNALAGGADLKSRFESVHGTFHRLKAAAVMAGLGVFGSLMADLNNAWMHFVERDKIPAEHIDFFLRGIQTAKQALEETSREAHR